MISYQYKRALEFLTDDFELDMGIERSLLASSPPPSQKKGDDHIIDIRDFGDVGELGYVGDFGDVGDLGYVGDFGDVGVEVGIENLPSGFWSKV
ncbi:hypothetical protein ACLB2K_034648 [Fragaria x ananassa]